MADSDAPANKESPMMEMFDQLDRTRRSSAAVEEAQANNRLYWDKITARTQAVDDMFASIQTLHADINFNAKIEIAAAVAKIEEAEAFVKEARRELELKRTEWRTKEYLVQQMLELLNAPVFGQISQGEYGIANNAQEVVSKVISAFDKGAR